MKNPACSIFCAGFGGQGVMFLGQLMSYGAILEGKYVTWLPSYGPEMRGGTANCGVIISDTEIGSPFVTEADVVVVLNQPSLDKYEGRVSPLGFLIYNEDMAKYTQTRNDIKVIPVRATEIAVSAGNERAANIVLLGAAVAAAGFIADKTARAVIADKLGTRRPELLDSSIKAYELGREAGLLSLNKR